MTAACADGDPVADRRSASGGAGGGTSGEGSAAGSLTGGVSVGGAPESGGTAQAGEAGALGGSSSGEVGQGGEPTAGFGGCNSVAGCGGSGGHGGSGGRGGSGGNAGSHSPGGESSGSGGATAGETGEGGETQGPSPSCVDGDPCTLDLWNGSTCEHPAAPESTPCDDGRFCTSDDQCVSGVCVGSGFSSEAAVLGEVRAFGGFAESRRDNGLVALLSERRAIFADESGLGTELTLVGVESGKVIPLSTARSNMRLARAPISSWLWVNQLTNHIVPLSSDRFAFLGSRQIEIYDVLDEQMVRRSIGAIPERIGAAAGTVFAAAGWDGRLWVGGDLGLSELTVSEAGEVTLGPEQPKINHCHGLALSPDGKTLYVATLRGLHVMAVGEDGALTESAYLYDGDALFNVRVNESWLAIQKMVPPVGFGDTDVLRVSDLSRLATFPYVSGKPIPLGFALTDTGILVERYEFRGADGEGFTAEHYGFSAGTLVLQSSTEYRDRQSGEVSIHRDLARPEALGGKVVLTPLRQVFDLTRAGFTPALAERQGSFETVRALDATRVAAIGTYTSQTIDLSTPLEPAVRGRGVLSPAVQPLKLELNEQSGRLRMLSAYPDEDILRLPLNDARDEVSVFSPDTKGVLAFAGSFELDRGPSHLFAASGSLFQLSAMGRDQFVLRRFGWDRVASASGGAALVADVEASLAVPADDTHDHFVWRFHVDEATGDAVIVDSQQDVGTGQTSTSLTWATLGRDGFTDAVSRVHRTGDSFSFVLDVKVFGDRAAVLSNEFLSVVKRHGDELEIIAELNHGVSSTLNPSTLLGFDGDAIYLGDGLDAGSASVRVHVLDSNDLTERASYELPEPVVGMASAGSTIAFASANRVFTASPACE
ncbi:MAG TPA: hypothetical protein VFQ61_17570 [Polyangiaceae bacterium]|nr:hypothetical protein [Polyangiaceae bacterium]